MIQHKRRLLHSFILASTLLLPACGGGNQSASPQVNTGNIPNLATRPSAQSSPLKTVRVAGSVFDSLTGEPIDQAEILLEIQDLSAANNSISNPASNTSTPVPASIPVPASTPFSSAPAGNTATPKPLTPTPVPSGSFAPPNLLPGVTPTSSPNALPANENVPPLPGGTPPPLDPEASLPFGIASVRFAPMMAAVAPAFMLAQNTSASASPANQPDAFKAKTNNRGKFFANDVPEGQYVLTVTAPGYRTLTLTQLSPNQMDIPLTPQNTERLIDVIGTVLSPATEEPVSDATVTSSFLLGEAIGVPAITDGAGQFLLPAVPFGKRSLVAFVQSPDQRITKMGSVRDLLVNSKSLKQQSTSFPGSSPRPSASATANPTRRKALEDSVEGILNDASPSPSASVLELDPGFTDEFPELPEASPILEPRDPVAPRDPKAPDLPSEFDPGNNSVDVPVENEEELVESDGFSFLDAATELITGKKPEASSDQKTYPVISLHSVLSDMVLAGDVKLPEGYTLKSMDVYMILPTVKNAHPQEVYLYSKQFRAAAKTEPVKTKGLATGSQASAAPTASGSPKASQPFRVSLPEPVLTEKYHLQFTAADKEGRLTYHHLYNIDAANEKLEVSFLPVPTLIEIEGEDVNAVPPVPGFGWEPVSGAEIYHVTLAAGSGAKQRVVWEAWTKSTQLKYPLSRKPYRLKEQEVYTLSVDAMKGLTPAFNGKRQQTAHPAYQMIWTDLSRMSHTPFEVVE